jgi:TPP-dependent pyruvate/acetoin dehydrogenase alpha subunit
VPQAALDAVRDEAQSAVAAALERARSWPEPDPAARFEHVYVADPRRAEALA